MIIENLKIENIDEAIKMIKNTFDEFIASDFSQNGIDHFYEIISRQSIHGRLFSGNIIYIAKSDNKIAGYIEIKDLNHIYLLFVKKEFHRRGIAKKLLDFSINFLTKSNPKLKAITVNSAPYSVKIYERLGFNKIAEMQLKNGILSYPMSLTIW
ncbi:MAG: GNAT family N-acetyltransferase [Leptospirales bacterium]|nr:GNAT family N-acetyltransferase [Leptospirales bacterium]